MAKIISFEGIDGTGKTTQISLIKVWLESHNYKVTIRSYPVYDSYFGQEIGKHLSGKIKKSIDSKSMALWYAMDRWNDYNNNKKIFEESDIVLLNRYTLSSMVYQVIRGDGSKDLADWIENLEHEVLGLPRPDLYLIFDLPFRLALDNNKIKGKRDYIDSQVDKYEKDEKLQTNARNLYLEFAKKYNYAKTINCFYGDKMLSVEEIAEKVRAELRSLLKID